MKLKQCEQLNDKDEQCPLVARYRYTWPGRTETFICETHVIKLRQVANAMGLELQVIDLFNGLRGDVDEWAALRLAQLREAGEPAELIVTPDGPGVVIVGIRLGDGTIERPPER